jgi:thioredoxin 1
MSKKILSVFALVVMLGFLVLIFALKDNMNAYVSNLMKQQQSFSEENNGSVLIDSLYNYSVNGEPNSITFLEFGAKGCSACMQMEKVMAEIKAKYPNRVKVVFYNIMLSESQHLMKYYGISAIPTQILLDKSGSEYFRHIGYYSKNDLEKEFKKIN